MFLDTCGSAGTNNTVMGAWLTDLHPDIARVGWARVVLSDAQHSTFVRVFYEQLGEQRTVQEARDSAAAESRLSGSVVYNGSYTVHKTYSSVP